MILIISSELDPSTSEIIKWIHYYKREYIRINETDTVTIEKIEFDKNGLPEIVFQINGGEYYSTSTIKSYWYRRGLINYDRENFSKNFLKDEVLQQRLNINLERDYQTMINFFLYVIESKNPIGSMNNAINNKFIHLDMAKSVGLKVPLSLVGSKKEFYVNLKNNISNKNIITKCASDGFHHNDFALYTYLLSEADELKLEERFPLSFFQEQIIKRWEIRIFFLKNEFYSMAILSQNDDKTKTDFRKYNYKKPNYSVPYNLPLDIRNKLKKFMKLAELNTGSIDMIYSLEGEYYFLEVNPVGQFGMVSYPCNYFIERTIAKKLISNES